MKEFPERLENMQFAKEKGAKELNDSNRAGMDKYIKGKSYTLIGKVSWGTKGRAKPRLQLVNL